MAGLKWLPPPHADYWERSSQDPNRALVSQDLQGQAGNDLFGTSTCSTKFLTTATETATRVYKHLLSTYHASGYCAEDTKVSNSDKSLPSQGLEGRKQNK